MLTIRCYLNGAVNGFCVEMLTVWINEKNASTVNKSCNLSKIDKNYTSICQSQRKHNMIQ